jgi:hypothetical protein
MDNAYFEPWKGKKFSTTKVMILSESAYSWHDEGGNVVDPSPAHPTDSLLYWMSHFRKQKYFTAMGRALCGKKAPTVEELNQAWDEYAYTIFVQGTVGLGAKRRPSPAMFEKSRLPFLRLLEDIRPLKVIVTGKTMWNNHLPSCTGPHLCDDLQSYKLSDGTLVWCLAVPHPSNRAKGKGFQWEWVGKNIRAFRAINFPLRDK